MMKRRWLYFKWVLRTNRLLVLAIAGFFLLLGLVGLRYEDVGSALRNMYERYGVLAAETMMKGWRPGLNEKDMDMDGILTEKSELLKAIAQLPEFDVYGEDPAYERMLAGAWEQKVQKENEQKENEQMEGEETESFITENERNEKKGLENPDGKNESHQQDEYAESDETDLWADEESWIVEEAIALKAVEQDVILEKLADYDYVMKHFYNVHPTTTAGRDIIQAEDFLSMDFSVEQKPDQPQILIYHTHSQEGFADQTENPDATIVGVGAYLTELLKEQGYEVIHDTTVYDKRDGKLDRSGAYTYALDGITGILQKYPSIEVVLDLHRDGVNEDVHLVTEINGKPTAQIMFFNGTSQTPDGPIEYLKNPNRQANMAFSFQMQLAAKEQYPGLTRKIYLKGLRYNQHVRARTALVEVGAQTNTYAEALNAMEPLAEVLCRVLGSRSED